MEFQLIENETKVLIEGSEQEVLSKFNSLRKTKRFVQVDAVVFQEEGGERMSELSRETIKSNF